MIFYDCSTAPSPRRARMFIAEKGLSPEVRQVDLGAGAHLSADFLSVNPGGTVPVLVTDSGDALIENVGIVSYLEAEYPEPPLMGRNPVEKGQVATWNAICEMQGGMAIAEALRNSSPRMKDRALPGPRNYAQIPELAERGRARTAAFFDLLEERLKGRDYLATDHLTWADITGFVFVDFARVIRMAVPESHTATHAWFARIAERPSAKA